MKCKQKKTREAVTLLAPVMRWAIFSEGVKKYKRPLPLSKGDRLSAEESESCDTFRPLFQGVYLTRSFWPG